ncbi:MAG TPA: peptidoglycan-binding domain-containing protein, partial [Chthoniobacterales bacterium]
MNRFVVSVLAIIFCSAVQLFAADENVRAVQTRLKEGGFYFGDINGEYTSETAAAVTRYQIRNGLQISGKVDEPTAKALGVSATRA